MYRRAVNKINPQFCMNKSPPLAATLSLGKQQLPPWAQQPLVTCSAFESTPPCAACELWSKIAYDRLRGSEAPGATSDFAAPRSGITRLSRIAPSGDQNFITALPGNVPRSGLEDNHMGDHRIVDRIRIFGDVEIFLNDTPRVREEGPVSADTVSVPHQAASALPASASMCSQCLAINFAASLETRSKSLPTSERHSESSGWADQSPEAARYFEIEPESRMKAQSAFAVLQADNRNTVAIRSGPSCSSMIVSAKRTYFSDCAAIEAPAEKVLESLPTETRHVGAVKVNI